MRSSSCDRCHGPRKMRIECSVDNSVSHEYKRQTIVSVELWDEVQQALAEQRNVFANKNSHYLRGRVICANCGEYFMRTTRKKKTGKYK